MFGLVSKRAVIGLMFGSFVGIVDWSVSLLTDHLMGRLAGGLVAQLVSGLLVGLVVGLLFGILKAAWGEFVITRCWLALRGHLPWRLIGFLADAHQRGVLREVGAVYQFRHVQLQRRLADDVATIAHGSDRE